MTLAICLLSAIAYAAAEAPQPPSFQVIVHHDNAATDADRKVIADMFMKRRTIWPDKEPVRPVDLPPDSRLREQFSVVVLGRSVQQMRSYWQQRIFVGRELPPLELASDEDVVKFVSTHRGAIGYVSTAADLSGTKVLTVKAR